jgi:hypothetical protein
MVTTDRAGASHDLITRLGALAARPGDPVAICANLRHAP